MRKNSESLKTRSESLFRLLGMGLGFSLLCSSLLGGILWWKHLQEQRNELNRLGLGTAIKAEKKIFPEFSFIEGAPLTFEPIKIKELSEINSNDEIEEHLGQTIEVSKKEELNRGHILKDKSQRIDDAFSIPKGMYWRVAFWFDIYTKYDSNKRVIHHQKYPWIIFEVVDISPFVNKKGGSYWTKVARGERHVSKVANKVRTRLKRLANRKSYRGLKGSDRRYYNLLKRIPGKRKRVIKSAAYSIRSQTGQKDHFQKGLTRSARYFPAMEQIFSNNNLPTELVRLPLTESSFNLYATSKVGASGIWQFMPGIGSRMMKVSKTIDERRSPLKSTEAAARLLKENYTILWRQWPLAVTAYNHGPGGVKLASRRARSRQLGDIIYRYRSKRFSFASSNFYASYLAALHAEKYKEHLYDDLKVQLPIYPREYRLVKTQRAKTLVARLNLEHELFYTYNPDLKVALKKNSKLPKGLRIFIPRSHKLDLIDFKKLLRAEEDRFLTIRES